MASAEKIQEKKQIVEEIKAKISASQALVLVDYKGINVADDTAMRKEMRNAGLEYAVLKNTLLKRAFNELNYSEFDSFLNGTTAVAFSKDDVVAPAKLVTDCAKKYPALKVKCGLADGKFVDVKTIERYAALPSRTQLLSGLVYALNGLITGLAVCLNKIAEQKQN